MTHEWKPFTPDYDYEKRPYLVRTSDGTVCKCWPNAGIMNAMDASRRQWDGNAGVECKFAYPDDDKMGLRAMQEAMKVKAAAHADSASDLAHSVATGRQSGRTAMRMALMAAALAAQATGTEFDTKAGLDLLKRKACTHKFGIAGGFSECSSCEIRAPRRAHG